MLTGSQQESQMTDHKGLPVQGYQAQSDENIALANEGKELEERCLRYVEKVAAMDGHDARFAALGKTNIQQGFMWTIRAIFQPARLKLPEDVHHG